jgi:hypothetical protein
MAGGKYAARAPLQNDATVGGGMLEALTPPGDVSAHGRGHDMVPQGDPTEGERWHKSPDWPPSKESNDIAWGPD